MPLFLLAALSAFAFLANPLRGVPGCDSSIFIYVARRMMAGQVPYLDVFDQKGLLIYVLDAIGWSCGGVWGIWALDIVAFALGLVCVAKISRHWAALTVWIVLYHLVACGGNMPEMWIIVFSAWAYCLALRAQAEERWKWFAMGACVAMILMLKLNMIAVVVPLAIAWRLAGHTARSALWSVAGLLAGLAPFAAYLTVKGAWPALWEVYVCYNAQYASRHGWMPSVAHVFWPIAFLWAVNAVAWFRTRDRLLGINLVYLTAAWGLVLASGGSFRYYGPVLPACIMPLSCLVNVIRYKWMRTSIVALSFALIGGLVFMRNRDASSVRACYDELQAFRGLIEDRQSVTVLGCDCHVYQVLDAVCPGRFPFQGTVAKCSEHYRRQMVSDMMSGVSRYLIVENATFGRSGEYGLLWARETMWGRYNLIKVTEHYLLYDYHPLPR